MIRIILSFDHELPLGGVTRGFEDGLFGPTRRILDAAEKENVRICLFTDILCYLFYKKHQGTDFTVPYEEQLQYALKRGHDVQLHLHPHWLTTRYEQGSFIPSADFSLADFAGKEYPDNIEGIVDQGVQELNSICRTVKPDYQCTAFRAGGYNLWPETERILNALYNNGIRLDSSIPKGLYYKSAFSLIHYKNMPEAANWYIPLEGPLNKVSESGMFEIPIATRPAGLLTNLRHIYYKRKNKKYAYSAGKTIHSGKVRKTDKLRFVFSVRSLGFDTWSMDVNDLMKILRYNIKQYQGQKNIIMGTVSHPKNMGEYAVSLMTDFIRRSRIEYPDLQFVIHGDVIADAEGKL